LSKQPTSNQDQEPKQEQRLKGWFQLLPALKQGLEKQALWLLQVLHLLALLEL
jgi:hypothetical protein